MFEQMDLSINNTINISRFLSLLVSKKAFFFIITVPCNEFEFNIDF